ncbi:MAG: nucleotidyltransferase domain-containing protein [Phycisphaerae bacterium]
MTQIQKLGWRIGREFGANRVVLFGSFARGSATDDSDVDLLVILPFKGKSVERSVEMRMKLCPAFPVYLIVRSPQMVREHIEMGDDVMRDILEEGTVLYEADHG